MQDEIERACEDLVQLVVRRSPGIDTPAVQGLRSGFRERIVRMIQEIKPAEPEKKAAKG